MPRVPSSNHHGPDTQVRTHGPDTQVRAHGPDTKVRRPGTEVPEATGPEQGPLDVISVSSSPDGPFGQDRLYESGDPAATRLSTNSGDRPRFVSTRIAGDVDRRWITARGRRAPGARPTRAGFAADDEPGAQPVRIDRDDLAGWAAPQPPTANISIRGSRLVALVRSSE